MHRLILSITDPCIKVDHKDRNGLNNQRNNLRLATHKQNMANRSRHKGSVSKYLGVHWRKDRSRWLACITKDGVPCVLGSFKSEIDAAIAYNKAATRLHGEFANINKV